MKIINKCPICKYKNNKLFSSVTDLEYLSSNKNYAYYVCKKCDVIYLNNPPINQLKKIYPKNYYSFKERKDKSYLRRLLEIIKNFLDRSLIKKSLNKLSFESINCLDIGGGSGWMSNMLRELDSRVVSTTILDLEKSSKKIAETNGHEFICSNINDIKIKNRFHFVIMFNLIEHVMDPEKTLLKVNKSMKKGGILIIKTPNTQTISKNLFKNLYWGGLHAPRHWVLFNKENFSRLIKKSNFEIEEFFYTQGAPQWTASIIGSIYKFFELKPKKTMNNNFFTPILLVGFSIFDFLTMWFLKPAQMFVVVKKKN